PLEELTIKLSSRGRRVTYELRKTVMRPGLLQQLVSLNSHPLPESVQNPTGWTSIAPRSDQRANYLTGSREHTRRPIAVHGSQDRPLRRKFLARETATSQRHQARNIGIPLARRTVPRPSCILLRAALHHS